MSEWDAPEATPAVARWDATPARPDEFGATPGRQGSRWDATPTPGRTGSEATPRRNRWDDATPTPGRVIILLSRFSSLIFLAIVSCVYVQA